MRLYYLKTLHLTVIPNIVHKTSNDSEVKYSLCTHKIVPTPPRATSSQTPIPSSFI